jgi:hypothetical protein
MSDRVLQKEVSEAISTHRHRYTFQALTQALHELTFAFSNNQPSTPSNLSFIPDTFGAPRKNKRLTSGSSDVRLGGMLAKMQTQPTSQL